ncbi:hypothetical protein [Aquicella lusitana]|uniref:Uncharacterized protein n=1 Tax=Aquicella lusitana TaxID=254246 RepID=A0A370G8U5_9COXI|nr:hypothetical protein [Aquicella lusitana]RDI40187.1 hypothetical protein C8D86_12321 [Aquicella lusitana]VVC72422.1 hypothetical protein AQULUS_01340 [Aquicella lusitana]
MQRKNETLEELEKKALLLEAQAREQKEKVKNLLKGRIRKDEIDSAKQANPLISVHEKMAAQLEEEAKKLRNEIVQRRTFQEKEETLARIKLKQLKEKRTIEESKHKPYDVIPDRSANSFAPVSAEQQYHSAKEEAKKSTHYGTIPISSDAGHAKEDKKAQQPVVYGAIPLFKPALLPSRQQTVSGKKAVKESSPYDVIPVKATTNWQAADDAFAHLNASSLSQPPSSEKEADKSSPYDYLPVLKEIRKSDEIKSDNQAIYGALPSLGSVFPLFQSQTSSEKESPYGCLPSLNETKNNDDVPARRQETDVKTTSSGFSQLGGHRRKQ